MLTSTTDRQRRAHRIGLHSVIERRLLVNYRVDPQVVAALLPAPFRPHLVHQWAVAGLCLLRVGHARPPGVPAGLGMTSENVAHRIAVRWCDDTGAERTGVYVPQRHSASRLTVAVGDRLLGVHDPASFRVSETASRLTIGIAAADGTMRIDVDGTVTDDAAGSPLFAALDEASAFFRSSPAGFSPSRRRTGVEGVELEAHGWDMAPVTVHALRASWFDDTERFPTGSIAFDSAFVMRDVDASWRRVTGP